MRNLKRALSLALSTVMLLGMMVVGTGASYADVTSKHNQEAIDVMQAVGVMIGDDKGNFNPDQKVTRNEMAVVMANLLDLKVSDFKSAKSPFADVPQWAAPYVAACKADGIIAGYSANHFGGSDTVTAAQAALMMMKALGYFQVQSDFGDDWQLAAVKQASKIELYDGIDAGASAALTRNEVAQLALNALEATMVENDADSGNISIGDIVISNGSKYVDRETTKYDYTQSNGKYVKDKSEKTLQLCENLYNEDLVKLDSGKSDNYGRPSTIWKYEKDEIGTYAKEPDAVYTANVKAKDLYSDLGLSKSIPTKNVTVYVDGNPQNDIEKQDIAKTNTAKYENVRGGAMEVYLTNDDTEATICYIYNYIGVVTDDNAKKDGDNGIYVEVDGAEYFIKDAVGYAEDDVVVATLGMKDNKVEAEIVGAPKTVTGYASAISSDKDLTIGGTKYYMGAGFTKGDGDVVDGIADKDFKADKDTSYKVYLDELGNMLAVVEDEDNSTDDVVYVYSVDVGSVLDGSKVKYAATAKVVNTDGTIEEYQVSDTYTKEGDAANDADYKAASALVGKFGYLNYDKSDDQYTITTISKDDYSAVNKVIKTDVKLGSDDTKADLEKGSSANWYLRNDTVYLFVELNDDKDDIDNVEVKTGGVNYTTTDGYFVADGKNVKYVVFTNDSYTAESDDVVYLDNEKFNGLTEDDYKTFDAYYLGDKSTTEITVASVDGTNAKDLKDIALNGFYKYSEKSDGALKLTSISDKYTVDKDSYFTANSLDNVDGSILEFTPKAGNKDSAVVDKAVVVDLTDADKASENAYGRNITSVSALDKLLEREVTEDGKTYTYTVSANIFVNEDNEVENIFITHIEKTAKVVPPAVEG